LTRYSRCQVRLTEKGWHWNAVGCHVQWSEAVTLTMYSAVLDVILYCIDDEPSTSILYSLHTAHALITGLCKHAVTAVQLLTKACTSVFETCGVRCCLIDHNWCKWKKQDWLTG